MNPDFGDVLQIILLAIMVLSFRDFCERYL